MMIDKQLLKDIDEYVKLNELGETSNYVNQLLKEAFMKEKYSISDTKKTEGKIIPDITAEDIEIKNKPNNKKINDEDIYKE